MENNIDFAEMMIEVVEQEIKKHEPMPGQPLDQPSIKPMTWGDLLTALQEYKKTEEHEILKLRKYKKE